jgi:hypothetical protein
MHKRGVGYLATLTDPQGMPVDELYRGTEWAEVVMRRNEPPKQLKAGQLIDYKCEYANREDRVVTQGLATTDEMCMFVGLYYPRNRKFELCGLNDQWAGAFVGAQWVGSGSKGGLETVGCFMSAKDSAEDKGESFYGCVVDSCPRIAKETSNVARCLATRGFGQCEEACKTSGAACKLCFAPKCQDAFMALAAAKCE